MKTRIVIVDIGYANRKDQFDHSVWVIPFEDLSQAKEYVRKIKQYWEKKKVKPGKNCMPIEYVSIKIQSNMRIR